MNFIWLWMFVKLILVDEDCFVLPFICFLLYYFIIFINVQLLEYDLLYRDENQEMYNVLVFFQKSRHLSLYYLIHFQHGIYCKKACLKVWWGVSQLYPMENVSLLIPNLIICKTNKHDISNEVLRDCLWFSNIHTFIRSICNHRNMYQP